MTRYLIIGGDSLIGSELAHTLSDQGEVVVSTRRSDRPGSVFVDLASGKFDVVDDVNADVAFVCAAMTNIQACEDDAHAAVKINVTETLRLIRRLTGKSCFVVWLSSNTVFNGQSPFPNEDSPYSPTTEYGRQKMATELAILDAPELADRVAIVRLSKVVSAVKGMASNFIRRLSDRKPCTAFSDLQLSPASLTYVCAGLKTISLARKPGIFHLSGAEELSYAQFADKLADHLGADRDLVVPGSSSDVNVTVLYRPQHPALGMVRTRRLLGLAPEVMAHLMDELVSRKCGNEQY